MKKKEKNTSKTMEKIRRCREHVHVLRDGETCSFTEHSKHNKIEEMSEQEAEILDWVEMKTEVELWKNNETGQEELWFSPKKHYETNKLYYRNVVFDSQTQNLNEVIGDNFREIAGLIAKDIKENVRKKDKWVFEKIVYKFCPNAECGENPCICRKKEI
jgi:hypothetical protein